MRARWIIIASALACTAAGAAAQGSTSRQEGQPARTGSSAAVQPGGAEGLQQLAQSAQRLRESIRAMARTEPGRQRERAMAQAHEALLDTQRVMMALPPELRNAGTGPTSGYGASVKKLMDAADALGESIQALARQAAGGDRARAVRQAHQALWETQFAMVGAFQAASDATPGAGRQEPKEELRRKRE